MIVTVSEMKKYLRVEYEEEDRLIQELIEQAQQICMDVARIKDEDMFEDEPVGKIAVMYTVAYLYEHREAADHHELTLSLRALLGAVRSPGF